MGGQLYLVGSTAAGAKSLSWCAAPEEFEPAAAAAAFGLGLWAATWRGKQPSESNLARRSIEISDRHSSTSMRPPSAAMCAAVRPRWSCASGSAPCLDVERRRLGEHEEQASQWCVVEACL